MAHSYKNIVITPFTANTNNDPRIVFSGGNTSVNTDITLRVYPDSNGTLSFEGAAGQLFSITNDLTNTIFSVNDVSGIPLIEVNVTSQQITFGQFYGNVGIGTGAANSSIYKLDVTGSANISSPTLLVAGQNVIASFASGNTYAQAVGTSGNAYTVVVGASGNAYANVVGTAGNTYATTVGTAANNYAGAMANSGNSWTQTIVDANLVTSRAYTNTSTTAANNYAGAMANAANGYATTINDANLVIARAYTNTSTTAANNYAGAMANAGNSWTQTIVDANLVTARAYTNTSTTASNTYAQAVGTAGNAYAVAVGTAANNYAGVMANSANAVATATFGTITNTTAAFAAANSKVASVTGTAGQIFSSGGTTPTINLISTGVTATTYGGATQIPVIVVDAFGRLTSASNVAVSGMDYPYVNTSTAAANNYAGAMANSANAVASATYASQSSLSTGLTSANNYAGAMANSANARADTKVSSVSGTSGRITSSGGTTPAIDLATAGAGAASYSSGISAVTVDAYGRVTAVTGSAGYVTSSGVTSVATGTGLTGGTITSTGTLSVDFATVATATNTTAAFAAANGANVFANTTYVRKAGDTITGDLTVQGNLTTSGVVTYANTQTLLIGDALITLNNDIPIAVAPSENAGIEVKRGSSANVALLWNEGSDRWTFTNDGTNYRLIASNTDVESANNYAGAMANAANVYATTINDANTVVARAYTNTSTTAANTYAQAVGTAGNTYAQTVGTSANNYAGAMANSANARADTKVSSVTGTSGRITSSGGTTPAIDLASGVVTPTAATGGISALTVDTYGRVTAITGSAGYVTSSGVTSVANGTGLTGGTITSTGTLSVDFATVATATNTTAAFAAANGKVASVSGTSGRITSSGGTTPAIDLATAGAGAATYSSGISAVTVDAYGRVTSVTGSAGYVTSSGVTSITAGTGLSGGTITSTGTISLPSTGPGAGSYSSGISAITLDAQGRVTAITGSAGYVTSSGVTSITAGTGLSGGTITSTGTISLPSTGPGAGSYSSGISAITLDAQGRVTAITGSAGYATAASPTFTGTVNMQAAIANYTLTDAANIDWNLNTGQVATVTLAGNRIFNAPTNLRVGTFILHILQDATGSRTLSWNTIFKWPAGVAPVLTTTASRRDIISFVCDGTNMYGSFLPDVR